MNRRGETDAGAWDVDLAVDLVTYRPTRVSFAVERRRRNITTRKVAARNLTAIYIGDPLPEVELARLRKRAVARYLEAVSRAADTASARCQGTA